ncbi:Ig-like domain (group 4) [Corynebacterium spheniscorum]|uniref:Ig-like domain (Group 4) n=2 Tax=Corynebacterium spheniscorum TaxID=185761 RepID=A0A1I2SPW4_9CORY|nr:Ig-like domain (group 4) [Corynebacterium spheniscorum]
MRVGDHSIPMESSPIETQQGDPSDPEVPLQFEAGVPIVELFIPYVYDGNFNPVPETWKVPTVLGDVEEGQITRRAPEDYPEAFTTHGPRGTTCTADTVAPKPEHNRELHMRTEVEDVIFTEPAPVHLTTTVGVAPSLPDEVLVVCDNGSSKMAPVTWDTLKPEAYEAPTSEGEPLVLKGAVNGVNNRATAYITISEKADPTPTPTPGVGSAILPGLDALALLHSAVTGSSRPRSPERRCEGRSGCEC